MAGEAPPKRFVRPVRTAREATWELVLKRNSIERLKQEKFPLDIVAELPELIAAGYEAVPEEDIVRLNWWGLTMDKPKVGTFMVRIKVPGGSLTPEQLRGIGRISTEYGRNYGELTTRQGLQLHWVRLDQLPAVLDAIGGTGLTTVGGEGDTVRNITSCPVAGWDPGEAFDVRPVIAEAARFFYGNREYSNLPRKHKYTISACPGQCNAPEIHDVALIGVIRDGEEGFAVRVGGGLSNTPRLSRDLGVFVPASDAIEVLRAITDVWQTDLRYRVSRAKSRIKFMVDDYGADGVRRKVEERLGRALADSEAPAVTADAEHLGLHAQKQEGLSYVGFPVPMGWLTGNQMLDIADIAESTGAAIRLTRQQNVILGDITDAARDEVLARMRDIGLPAERNLVFGNSIACTSHQFCNYSVAETKGKLQEILEVLDERFGARVGDLKIFMDGCPHACAHHWVGDIGLQGTTTIDEATGKRVEAYDVTVRGGLGVNPSIGKPLLRRIPTSEITDVIVRLVDAWLAERATLNGQGAAFTFQAFCFARDDETLDALARGDRIATAVEATDAVIVRVPGILVEHTGGADQLEVRPGTVREALESLREAYPSLIEHLLVLGEVNTAVNLYVGEEDIRSFDGLDTELRAGDELTILPALAGG